ncbi:hypothetical protein LCGC14_1807610 [marine sediment metagenome]|uniref:Uncharacterized protein n=1 Tax=marine sediment metagenome TaxID=412755 RepID=A0A0F9DH53_9ZZZZ
MAKDNAKFWLWLAISAGSVLVAIGVAWGVLSSEVEQQDIGHTAAIETIKNEGCLPARQSKTDIQLIQKDVESMLEKQDKSDIRQEAMDGKLDELLKR